MTASPSSAIIVPTAIALVQERILSSSPPSKGMSPSPQLHRGSSISLSWQPTSSPRPRRWNATESGFFSTRLSGRRASEIALALSNAALCAGVKERVRSSPEGRSLSPPWHPQISSGGSVGKNRRISLAVLPVTMTTRVLLCLMALRRSVTPGYGKASSRSSTKGASVPS